MFKLRVWMWTTGMFFMLVYLHAVFLEWMEPGRIYILRGLTILLPGFKWHSLSGFAIGLAESFMWGAYVALLFVVLHNYFYGIHHARPEVKDKEKGKAAA